MREQLCFVDRVECVLAFGFNHDPVVHYQIGSKAAFEFHIFIDKRHSFLSFNLHTKFLQFVGKAGFVSGFQQVRSQFAVNLDGGANYLAS